MSQSLGQKITASVPILTLGAGLLALFAGIDWFWVIFVIGWVVLTPLAGILFGPDGTDAEEYTDYAGEGADRTEPEPTDRSQGSKQDALERLRERYADGELSEEQFERKLERLLETETLENARDYVDGDGDGPTTFEEIRDREREEEYGTEYDRS